MTECFNTEFKEQLPELAAETLDAGSRGRVQEHVATCPACSEELEILRVVRATQIPVPFMVVSTIVRALPAPPIPVRPDLPWYRRASIQMAAAFLLVAGGLISVRQAGDRVSKRNEVVAATPQQEVRDQAAVPAALRMSPPAAEAVGQRAVASAAPKTDIALVSGLDEMTTGELTSLLKDVDALAAVPVAEPEQFSPVNAISENKGEG